MGPGEGGGIAGCRTISFLYAKANSPTAIAVAVHMTEAEETERDRSPLDLVLEHKPEPASAELGRRTMGDPVLVLAVTPPCPSAFNLVQLRTSVSS